MITKHNKKFLYMGMLVVVIFCTFAYGIHKIYGFSFYPDEFGYWASAAGILGSDWTQLTQNMPFYSFGYSAILTPIYLFSKNGMEAYRFAVFINMVLLCMSVYLLVRLIRFLYPEEDEKMQYLATGIAILYPGWILYMQTTMAEILLVFVYLLCSYLFMKFLSNPKISSGILLGLSLTYLFWVHMRSVGVVIAGAIVLVLWILKERKRNRNVVYVLLSLILFIGIGYLIKFSVIDAIYSKTNQELLKVNDFGGQINKIHNMLNWESIRELFLECVAKSFYLILATFGMIYWGMKHSVKTTIPHLFHKKAEAREYLKLFFLLSMLAQFAICAIFMHGGTRIDTIVYGRYMEFVLPPIMAMGVIEIRKSCHILAESLLMGGLTFLGVPVIQYFIHSRDLNGVVAPFMLGISYVLKEYDLSEYVKNQELFFLQAYLFGLATILLSALFFYLSKKIRNGAYVLILVIFLEIIGGIFLSEKYIYNYNSGLKMDIDQYDEVLSQTEGSPQVYYLSESKDTTIMVLQLYKKKIPIRIITMDEINTINEIENCILIIDYKSPNREKIGEYYENEKFSSSFLMYY